MKTNLNTMIQENLLRSGRGLLIASMLVTAGCLSSCKDEYDLDEKLPPNFGSNLMTHLEDNGFKTYAQLAKDLEYETALSGVSLKTLLAANDEAFERFFKDNNWGVSSYDQLTLAQKKLLLYNSMLDNSLQVLNLSSTSGTQNATVGNAMRRSGSGSVYDSVPLIQVSEMPVDNPDWDYYIQQGKPIACMKDMTGKPIIFFIEPFLRAKKITNEDINFLYNYTVDRQPGDANVGSTYIVEGNTRLPNGFIHRVNDVLVPLDNMAEIIRRKSNTQIYSRILERFSAPFYTSDEETKAYNYEYNTTDSLFEKRYYSLRSKGGQSNLQRPHNGPEVDAYLRFDPGWNSFYSDQKGMSSTVSMQSNMGVMLVPSDKAFQEYWDGAGRVIKDYYHEIDSVPNKIWAELLNNGMLNNFVNSVPSKFEGIVNSNQDRMGITVKDVDSVFLGCNGAVYLTNKVFAPTSFISVTFPALVNENMNIFYWAIDQLEYRSYLNSLDSYYSFFIPTNNAMAIYHDPTAFSSVQKQVWKFHYRADAATQAERVWATVYAYDEATGAIGDSLDEVRDYGKIKDRLEDLLDTHIIIGNKELGSNVENGHEYYRTKQGGIVAIKKENGSIYVQGTFQRDQNKWLKVTEIYDQTLSGGNGKSYILDGEEGIAEPIMTTRKSCVDILSEHEEFSKFYELLEGSTLFETQHGGDDGVRSASAAGNIATFNNFNYTIYVPTNESLEEVFQNKSKYKLFTWEEIAALEERLDSDPTITEDSIKTLKNNLEAFLKYHIQDNLLMIGLDYANDGGADYDEQGNLTIGDTFTRKYETANMNEESQKFYKVTVINTPEDISVKDLKGNTRKVQKKTDANGNALYNLTARDYQISKRSGNIDASSFAAIHLIDGPLFYK